VERLKKRNIDVRALSDENLGKVIRQLLYTLQTENKIIVEQISDGDWEFSPEYRAFWVRKPQL